MSGSLPRNHQTAVFIRFLEDLSFVAELKGDQWVAKRTSGMLTRTIILPDDAAVEPDVVIFAFRQQTIELQDEIRAAIDELRDQLNDIDPT